jgi:hypothetical protein
MCIIFIAACGRPGFAGEIRSSQLREMIPYGSPFHDKVSEEKLQRRME